MPSGNFGDKARTNSHGDPFEMRAYNDALNASVLLLLQADALGSLSSPEGKYSTQSKVSRNGKGVRLDTHSGSGQVDTALLRRGRTEEGGNIFQQTLFPDLLTHIEIVSSEKGMVSAGETRVKTKFSHLDQFVDPGVGQLSLMQVDEKGKTVRSFEPAVTSTRLDEKFRDVRGRDGEPMRVTEPAGFRANCRVPYSGKSECNYILRDRSIARGLGAQGEAVALHVTVDEQQRRDSRHRLIAGLLDTKIIVRTLDGRPLAVINQDVTLDSQGRVRNVDTSAIRIGAGKK